MEAYASVLIGMALVFGFYMAWNIGANDVANAMGTSVGSGALTLMGAVLVAAVLEFCGAYFAGSDVAETVRKGIIDTDIFTNEPLQFALGMLAALLAAGVWLQVASYFGWPVSTTHSIVGAVVGFGLVYGGLGAVHWPKVGKIAASWVVSPLLSGIISYLIFRLLLSKIFYSYNPVAAAKRWTPILVFPVFVILVFVLLFKGLKHLSMDLSGPQAIGVALLVGLIAAGISAILVRRIDTTIDTTAAPIRPYHQHSITRSLRKAQMHLQRMRHATTGELHDEVVGVADRLDAMSEQVPDETTAQGSGAPFARVERIFIWLQILTACFVAFAHGANDVANAIGPLAAVIDTARSGIVAIKQTPVSPWLLALGGVGIILGLATWGYRVIETVGKRITELTPSRGFAAEFGAATTIVIASKLSLPISTTHTLVGAVIGVGFARGLGALNLRTVRDILISWLVTLPAGAGLAILFYYGLNLIFPSP
jgi:PiT family inorganic phosphate transporter